MARGRGRGGVTGGARGHAVAGLPGPGRCAEWCLRGAVRRGEGFSRASRPVRAGISLGGGGRDERQGGTHTVPTVCCGWNVPGAAPGAPWNIFPSMLSGPPRKFRRASRASPELGLGRVRGCEGRPQQPPRSGADGAERRERAGAKTGPSGRTRAMTSLWESKAAASARVADGSLSRTGEPTLLFARRVRAAGGGRRAVGAGVAASRAPHPPCVVGGRRRPHRWPFRRSLWGSPQGRRGGPQGGRPGKGPRGGEGAPGGCGAGTVRRAARYTGGCPTQWPQSARIPRLHPVRIG